MRESGEHPVTILVVDDDADMRLYIRSLLEIAPRFGRVIEAADGVEALMLVRAGVVDMVISDIVLPRMDGTRLCEGIRRDPRLRHIPVLLISGEVEPEDRGGCDFLAKPFNARQLRRAVDRASPRSAPTPPQGP